MCTINKSAHTKKVWKLIVCTSYIQIDDYDIYIYIYIYIYVYGERENKKETEGSMVQW